MLRRRGDPPLTWVWIYTQCWRQDPRRRTDGVTDNDSDDDSQVTAAAPTQIIVVVAIIYYSLVYTRGIYLPTYILFSKMDGYTYFSF